MFMKKSKAKPWFSLDDSILAEIWEAVWKHDEIRCVDIDNFSISVQEGSVQLYGHINREDNLELIEKVVRSVPGVIAVENRLVVDRELSHQVAEAFARDERTRPFILLVNCFHGWVSLDGQVPSCELQLAAEEDAAHIPSVRGVVSLPRVAGQPPEALRRAVQPRIDTPLYGRDGEVGVVSQVVIQPRNRLVTQIIVRDLRQEKYLIPVEALQVVNTGSAFLDRSFASLAAFPALTPADFSPAPSNWNPPYPYKPAEVLWPAHADQDHSVFDSTTNRKTIQGVHDEQLKTACPK